MSSADASVERAIDRWEQEGLVPSELADRLREDQRRQAARSSRSGAQYALAATGAVILLMASGVLADWLWPLLDAGGRSVALGLTGLLVHFVGLMMRGKERWRAASYLLQITGLLILLGTFTYSEAAWPDASFGGVVVGVLALATPLVAAPRSLRRRDPVMPAAHLALGLAFLAVFLSRALGLEVDEIAWTLDAVLAVLAAVLLRALAQGDTENDWALNAFVAALYAGLVLVVITSLEPLGLEDGTLYPVDLWLLGMAALTLWGIHLAPAALQRAWYERQLAVLVLLSIPMLLITADRLWDAPIEVGSALVAAVGGLGLRYAIRAGARSTLGASCVALMSAAWAFGLERGGALGVVLALMASAALLFWVSSRLGWRGESPRY